VKKFRDYEGSVWEQRQDGTYISDGVVVGSYAELDDDFGPLAPVNVETEQIIRAVLQVIADDAEYAYEDGVGVPAEVNHEIHKRMRAAVVRLGDAE
jgi:hypothetical protein